MDKKKTIAKLLSELHDKVMLVQDELNDIDRETSGDEDWYDDLQEAISEVDGVESTTSELDCSWNNYDE